MHLCRRAVEFNQVIDADGTVRICSWLYDGGVVGKLSQNNMAEIYHSPEAEMIRAMHACGDHSNCNPNACPWVANQNVEENSIDIDQIPDVPDTLLLAYENVCNYHCVMCTIPDCMEKNKAFDMEAKYNRVDEELRKVLPYVKHLSANGLGELFASRHILKLLSEWKPVADPSEIKVDLETNGSLFNEKNWKQIENLGQYHLEVHITILSFDEKTYQELSGTTLPISNLIDNLRFVKSLRERGVINYLELATVYQDKNFRTLPEFCRRCIDEFGADYVRLRPFEPWVDPGIDEWLKDVRNQYNPYHEEFLEVMKDPIFKNPKVHDWGGGNDSGLGKEVHPKAMRQFKLIDKILCDETALDTLEREMSSKSVVVYGLNTLGKFLATVLQERFTVPCLLDRNLGGSEYHNIPIKGINQLDEVPKDSAVIIALVSPTAPAVEKLLRRAGFTGKIFTASELDELLTKKC